jgi:hypothetical protein
MDTRTATPALDAGLAQLIDYAGLFPPAQLAMTPAVEEYGRAIAGAYRWMLGRFVVPAARLPELRSASTSRAPLELSVIAPVDAFPIVAAERAAGWARIAALEVPLGARSVNDLRVAAGDAGLGDLPIYAEGTTAFAELAGAGFGAKLRCGGVEPSAYPAVERVAAFIARASAAGVPFKATAGLHHPIRHFNEAAGATMHGFLNVLAAAVFASRVDEATIARIIADEDRHAFALGETLRWRDLEAGAVDVATARRERFVSYGSCSFEEPVDDLVHLSILHAAH